MMDAFGVERDEISKGLFTGLGRVARGQQGAKNAAKTMSQIRAGVQASKPVGMPGKPVYHPMASDSARQASIEGRWAKSSKDMDAQVARRKQARALEGRALKQEY